MQLLRAPSTPNPPSPRHDSRSASSHLWPGWRIPFVAAPFRAALLALLSIVTAASHAQDASSPFSIPPQTWATDGANNEILLINHPGSTLRYRLHVIDEKGDQVRDQIETPEGSVARLILRDGKPITQDEDSAERERLKYLLDSPAVFAHHIKNEQAYKKLGFDLL